MAITLDGTLGITTPAETVQGALTTTGNTILGDASTDTLNVGNGGLVKDASGNVGIGTTTPSTGTLNRQLTINSGASNLAGVVIQNNATGTAYNDGTYLSTLNTSDFQIVNQEAGYVSIGTNSTERMRIDSSGNLLVGTTTGGFHKFVKSNASDYACGVTNTSATTPYGVAITLSVASPNDATRLLLLTEDSTATRMTVRSNGGIANYSANNVNLSDRREKTNFAPATSYLDKICAIPVQTFNYIDQNLEEDGGLTLGVVAQDVQAVAPELVMESNWAGKDDEPKMRLSIYQTDLQYALMKCIQEQQALIIQLQADVAALKALSA